MPFRRDPGHFTGSIHTIIHSMSILFSIEHDQIFQCIKNSERDNHRSNRLAKEFSPKINCFFPYCYCGCVSCWLIYIPKNRKFNFIGFLFDSTPHHFHTIFSCVHSLLHMIFRSNHVKRSYRIAMVIQINKGVIVHSNLEIERWFSCLFSICQLIHLSNHKHLIECCNRCVCMEGEGVRRCVRECWKKYVQYNREFTFPFECECRM